MGDSCGSVPDGGFLGTVIKGTATISGTCCRSDLYRLEIESTKLPLGVTQLLVAARTERGFPEDFGVAAIAVPIQDGDGRAAWVPVGVTGRCSRQTAARWLRILVVS